MDQSLYVDPYELRNTADKLRALAAETTRMVSELKAGLADEGECWGDDEPGKAIGESYVPALDNNMQGFENLIQNIEAMSSNLRATADNFETQDRDAGNDVRNPSPGSTYPTYPDLGYPPPNNPSGQTTDPDRTSPGVPPAQQYSKPPGSASPATAGTGTSAQQPARQQPANSPAGPGGDSGSSPRNADPNSPGSDEAGDNQQQTPSQQATSGPGSPAAQPSASVPSTGTDRRARAGTTSAPSTRSPGDPNASGPATPGKSGLPWSKKPGTGTPPEQQSPPRVSPPRRPTAPKAPPEPKQRKAEAPKPLPRPVTADEAMRILIAMADRHNLRIAGFETSGISTQTAREIAEAVDTVLAKYALPLHGIAVEDSDDAPSRVENRAQAAAPEPWIVLDRRAVADPGVLSGRDRTSAQPVEDERRPMHMTLLRELGSVVDLVGGFRARQTAQRALITEYLRVTGAEGRRLRQVTDGYRHWRDQLTDYSFRNGVLDRGRALSDGFATVVQGGAEAPGPAKVLHRLLLTMARLDMR